MNELTKLDPRMLIFLRQLREINVTVMRKDGKIWQRKLLRTDAEENGVQITTLYENTSHSNGKERQYYVTKHPVNRLPKESKRPQCSESEILLAFPVADFNKGPIQETQSVYAFLPIRSYGFQVCSSSSSTRTVHLILPQFLLQGDFLLTASRGDIDTSSPWNRALRDASANAFVQSIVRLNWGPLKYFWPHYLPVGNVSYFEPMREEIFRQLAGKRLLETCEKTLADPLSLSHVPLNYFAGIDDKPGKPFTLCSHTASQYLSLHYPDWAREMLCALGIKKLSPEGFLKHLQLMISDEPAKFRGKPQSWHSQLAKCLHKLALEKGYKERILDLEIIPLRKERPLQDASKWVSARGRKIFLGGSGDLTIPNGVEVDIVHKKAEEDDNRRNMFKYLGVKACDAAEISHKIIEMHSEKGFPTRNLNVQQLLQHALFVLNSPWRPPQDQYVPFWFATAGKGEKLYLGTEVYIRMSFEKEPSTTRVMAELEKSCPFIHPNYHRDGPDDKKWLPFLCASFGLATLPRLVATLSDDHFRLSEDMKATFQKCKSADVLELLRDNWDYYATWVEDDRPRKDTNTRKASKLAVRSALGALIVESQAGFVPLRGTILPTVDQVVDEIACVRTLKVRDPKNERWQCLRHFGVAIKNDVHYYLACLEHMAGLTTIAQHKVAHVYERIEREYREGHETIIWCASSHLIHVNARLITSRETFREKNLIYTTCGSTAPVPTWRWVSMDECIAKQLSVETEYPECKILFRALLASGPGGLQSLIAAMLMTKRSTKLSLVSGAFIKMSQAMEAMSNVKAAKIGKKFGDKPIFPIRERKESEGFDSLKAIGNSDSWFVADVDHLAESFVGRADLLAFPMTDLHSMSSLLMALNIQSRKLSQRVMSKSTPRGNTKTDWIQTDFLQARSPFIIRYVIYTFFITHDILFFLSFHKS